MLFHNKAALCLAAIFASQVQAKEFAAVPGEYVVKLKPSMSVMNTVSLERKLGERVKRTISNELGLVLIQRPMIETQYTGQTALAKNPAVAYAEPNYIYKAFAGAQELPQDPNMFQLWGLVNSGQIVNGDAGSFAGSPGVDIDARRAWKIQTGSSNVLVAVIDTGLNYNEPDLAPNVFLNSIEQNGDVGVDDDGNGFIDDIHGYNFPAKDGNPMDVMGHGTHVSGTIGARANDNVGIVGVNWEVTLLPVRFLGDDGTGNLADAVASVEYAIKMKAKIINASWGGGAFAQALLDAITHARDAGILFVAAAGNEGSDNDVTPSYPASYQLDNVIAVAAADPTGKLADFSNIGRSSVHLAAPGVDILSHSMKGLESWSGTSMAAPHVSGVAALLLAQDSSLTYLEVKKRLLAGARPLAGIRGKTITGGMVNAYYALMNQAAPIDENDPFNWKQIAQSGSTPHPYSESATKTWTLKVPGAKEISVHFEKFQTETNYDKVQFAGADGKVVGTLSGKLGDVFGPRIPGDTVVVTFTSDKSNNDYGFDLAGLAFR